MSDLWEPTAADRAAYGDGVHQLRERGSHLSADAVLTAGLRAAFASLRARVGEPAGQLIGGGPYEYQQANDVLAANVYAADGWRVAYAFAGEWGPVYVMERSRQPEGPS